MSAQAEKTQQNKSQSVSNSESQMLSSSESALQFVDNRPVAIAQRKLQEMANNSPQVAQLKAFQEMINVNRSPIQLKGGNWGKLQNKVVGTKAKVSEQLDQAGTDESVREEATNETFRKRLSGGDWEETNRYEVVPDGGKLVKKPVLDERGQKVQSKHKLSEAEKAGLKKYKGTEGLSDAYQEMAKKHLKKFDKSHAFISEWAYGNILNVWKSWGADANFVSPLSEAESIYKKAVDEEGIGTLEKVLGISAGAWSNKGKTSTIYRFIVNDPDKFNLRLPSGAENQAYQEEWLSGGKTLGGGSEAVIKNMTLEDLRNSVASGAIEIFKINFIGGGNAEQTKISSI